MYIYSSIYLCGAAYRYPHGYIEYAVLIIAS